MSPLPMVDLEDLPEPDLPGLEATAGRNAIGAAPERVLFLWPFARPTNLMAQVIGHGWVLVGPVHILKRPGRGLMNWVLPSVEDAVARLDSFSDAPGWQKPPKLRWSDGHWGRYHGYPVHPLAVDDAIWRDVFDLLSDGCELFVVDLTANRNADNLSYELVELAGRVHPSRQIFLIDEARADIGLCVDMFAASRHEGRAESRFPGSPPPTIFVYDSQARDYVARAFQGAFGGKASIPIAAKVMSYLRGR